MTRLAHDLLTDETLRGTARSDFDARRAGRAYVSPLLDVDAPADIPEAVAHQPKDGADEMVEPEG